MPAAGLLSTLFSEKLTKTQLLIPGSVPLYGSELKVTGVYSGPRPSSIQVTWISVQQFLSKRADKRSNNPNNRPSNRPSNQCMWLKWRLVNFFKVRQITILMRDQQNCCLNWTEASMYSAVSLNGFYSQINRKRKKTEIIILHVYWCPIWSDWILNSENNS